MRRDARRGAVDERVKFAASIARDDDRRVAEEGRLKVAGLRNLGRERDEIPERPGENLRLLLAVDLGIRQERIRDPCSGAGERIHGRSVTDRTLRRSSQLAS